MKQTKKSKWVKFPETSCLKCHKFMIFCSGFSKKKKSHLRLLNYLKDCQCQNTSKTKFYAWTIKSSISTKCLTPLTCTCFSTNWKSLSIWLHQKSQIHAIRSKKNNGFTALFQAKVIKKLLKPFSSLSQFISSKPRPKFLSKYWMCCSIFQALSFLNVLFPKKSFKVKFSLPLRFNFLKRLNTSSLESSINLNMLFLKSINPSSSDKKDINSINNKSSAKSLISSNTFGKISNSMT